MAIKTRSTQTSKGERRSIANCAKVKAHPIDAALNIFWAWKNGKNPWVTVENPEKNKPFVRVRSNDLWGDFRRRPSHPNSAPETA